MGLVFREHPPDFVAADTVAARIRARIVGIGNYRAGYDLGHNLSQFANAIVLVGAAYVKGFIEYFCQRRVEDGDVGAGDILNVHNGPPWCAV